MEKEEKRRKKGTQGKIKGARFENIHQMDIMLILCALSKTSKKITESEYSSLYIEYSFVAKCKDIILRTLFLQNISGQLENVYFKRF